MTHDEVCAMTKYTEADEVADAIARSKTSRHFAPHDKTSEYVDSYRVVAVLQPKSCKSIAVPVTVWCFTRAEALSRAAATLEQDNSIHVADMDGVTVRLSADWQRALGATVQWELQRRGSTPIALKE